MQTDKIVALLRDAATRCAALSFERVESLKRERWFKEIGLPNEAQSGNYCQIETELLDCLVEDGVDVLHVSVMARDEFREYGTSMFIYKDGRFRWDKNIFEFVSGIPNLIEKAGSGLAK